MLFPKLLTISTEITILVYNIISKVVIFHTNNAEITFFNIYYFIVRPQIINCLGFLFYFILYISLDVKCIDNI